MEAFAEYSHALVSVAAVCLIALLQNLHVGIARGKHELAPDAVIPDDYNDPTFRIFRAYANSVESLPAFIGAVLVAVLLGANPFWINLLASLHLLSRLAFWYVYISGTGKARAGLRTFIYVAGWAINLVIAAFAILAGVL